jgi:hypothetical protein
MSTLSAFTVVTDSNGHEILYEGRAARFNLTKNHLVHESKSHQVEVREARPFDINKWRKVAHPQSFLDINRHGKS